MRVCRKGDNGPRPDMSWRPITERGAMEGFSPTRAGGPARVMALRPAPGARHGCRLAAEDTARERLDAFLTPTHKNPTVAHDRQNDETPDNAGVLKYRYRDSNWVSRPRNPVFSRNLGPIWPAGGRWGRPEPGHCAPSFAP